jgi:HEXXH motif-containing protein
MYVKLLVPYRSSFHSSFTEACMMGAVFLSEAMWPFSSDVFTAEHLLHEVAHLRLTLIWEADPLIEAGRAADYNSPWRRDPRPMSGLVQAIFAFGRIAGFHRRAYALTGDARHEARHAESARLLAAGMKELQDGPALHFTEAGERLWADLLLEAAA